MGKALPKSAIGRKTKPAPIQQSMEKSDIQAPDIQAPDIQALKDENARLREFVTQLSEIVIKNIVDNIEDC